MEKYAKGVDPDHVVEALAIKASLVGSRGERRKCTHQRHDAKRLLRSLLGKHRVHHHDDDAEDAQHQLRKDPNVVNGRNHRPITCSRACIPLRAKSARTNDPGAWAACAWTALENCRRVAATAGSMECSQSMGATPMTSAAIASGHKETRSRASRSRNELFAGLLTAP